MGAGNWIPKVYRDMHGDLTYEMVYVVLDKSEEDDDIAHFMHRELIRDILNLLPYSFYTIDKWEYRDGFIESMHILAENGLMHILMESLDCGRTAVCFVPVDYAPAFKYEVMKRQAKKVFDALADAGYELMVRTGPWTSAPYTK